MSESSGSGSSMLPELLTVLFVGLKLAGIVDWSWWWVLSPILVECAFLLFLWGVIALITWRGKK